MKILVTGSEGFIGREVCSRLRSEGHIITPYDFHEASSNDVITILGDECLYEEKFDAVIHLAAISNILECENQELACETNIIGTARVMEFALRNEVPVVVFASSAAVYGDRKTCLKETDTLNPANYYGFTKMMGEHLVGMFKGVRGVSLRLFNVYGRNGKGVLNLFEDRAFRGQNLEVHGNAWRNFIHVDDVVEAILLSIHNENMSGVYNVCSEYKTSIRQLAQRLAKLYEVEVIQKEELKGIFHSHGNNSKLRACGWEPKHQLEK